MSLIQILLLATTQVIFSYRLINTKATFRPKTIRLFETALKLRSIEFLE